METPVRIGLVGVGAFGEFCLEAFAQMPEVQLIAIADLNHARAKQLAGRYGALAYATLEALLDHPEIEIVALNTPPYLHAAQGLAILNARMHLFCEKPLALTVEEGERLMRTAKANSLRMTLDYVMRHNPFWKAAALLAQSGVLGSIRHMDLANHAGGLELAPEHWFWDAAKSGGIWVEHGVHFFDAFAWVTGQPGEIISSAAYLRGDGVADRVEALVHFGDTAARFYHAFDQSGRTEQTTVRITFAQGYATLNEWLPTSLKLLTPVEQSAWESLLPGNVEVSVLPDGRTFARAYAPEGKSALYRASIQAGMRNLAQAAREASIPLVVTGEHGLASLRLAAAAEQKAQTVT